MNGSSGKRIEYSLNKYNAPSVASQGSVPASNPKSFPSPPLFNFGPKLPQEYCCFAEWSDSSLSLLNNSVNMYYYKSWT